MEDSIQFGVDFDRADIVCAHFKFWLDVATSEIARQPMRDLYCAKLRKAVPCYFRIMGAGNSHGVESTLVRLNNEAQDEIYTQLCVRYFGGPFPTRVA